MSGTLTLCDGASLRLAGSYTGAVDINCSQREQSQAKEKYSDTGNAETDTEIKTVIGTSPYKCPFLSHNDWCDAFDEPCIIATENDQCVVHDQLQERDNRIIELTQRLEQTRTIALGYSVALRRVLRTQVEKERGLR